MNIYEYTNECTNKLVTYDKTSKLVFYDKTITC